MAAYLDACIDESDGDSAFIAKALGDIARAQGMSKVARAAACRARVFTAHCPANAAPISPPS